MKEYSFVDKDLFTPKTPWDKLSIAEKATMMKAAISEGVYNLKDIKQKYNEFAEGGDTNDLWTMEDEAKYREWRQSLPANLRNTNDNDYDMRGAFKAGMQPTLEVDGLYHLQSRDPQTGRILNAPHHPTYLQAINTDARLGYFPKVDSKGQTYTQTWKGNKFDGGGNLFGKAGQMQIGSDYWQSQTQEPTFIEKLAEFNRQQEIKKQQQREALRRKMNTVGRRLAEENIRESQTESNDNLWIETPLTYRKKNPHLAQRTLEGAKAHAAWEKEHPNLTAWGNVLGAIPFAVAATPAVAGGLVPLADAAAATTAGQAITAGLAPLMTAANTFIAGAPALTWADTVLTSIAGAHGIQTAVEDRGISPTTALEITPMIQLTRPAAKYFDTVEVPSIENFVSEHPALYQYPQYAIGKFKYGFDAELPTLYRKFRNLPKVENGRITISNPNNRFAFDNGFGEESPIITNMTTDAPVRSHGLGDWDRDLTLAFPGKTLLGKKVISTRPSDTFTYEDNISVPVKNVVGFTGRPKEITFLQNSGIRSVTSPEAEVFWESGAEDLSKQIGRWRAEQARRVGHKGINLGKNTEPSGDFRNYATAIESLTRETFKSPTMKDYEFMDYVFRPKYSSQAIPKTNDFTIKFLDEHPLFGEWVGSTERRRYLEQPWRWNNVMYDPLTAAENKFRSSLNIGLKPEYKK